MAVKLLSRDKPNSLNARIRQAERRRLQSQRRLSDSGNRLYQHLRQRMTAPATLWLGGGIGFMFGELTKSQTFNTCKSNEQSIVTETSALNLALNFITFIHNLYIALPLVLIIKSCFASIVTTETIDSRLGTAPENLAPDQSDQAIREQLY
ncbi:MAG: hypothetical protein ABSB19_06160 [Methylomonas sp.]|jgi:hypothetical protein